MNQSVVEILRDTLKWLEPMEPKSDGVYIDLWHLKDFNTFRDGVQGCEVCAKGALVLAHLCELERPTSDLTDDTKDRLSVENQARNLVGYDNANLMEIAFERWGEYSLGRKPTEVEARAYRFGCRISDDRIRLRAILENAIKHGGTFTP